VRILDVNNSLKASRLFLGLAGFRRLVVFVFAVVPESSQTPCEIRRGNLLVVLLLFILVRVFDDFFSRGFWLLFDRILQI